MVRRGGVVILLPQAAARWQVKSCAAMRSAQSLGLNAEHSFPCLTMIVGLESAMAGRGVPPPIGGVERFDFAFHLASRSPAGAFVLAVPRGPVGTDADQRSIGLPPADRVEVPLRGG